MAEIRKGYGYIIDEVIPQKRSRELVRLIIPILIRWAKQGQTKKTYNHLIKELGYNIFSGIGRQLGNVDQVFKRFRVESGDKTIPMLNTLVKDKNTMLPSEGFSIVYPNYETMTNEEKKLLVIGLDTQATEYQNWEWVLTSLELMPSVIDTAASETAIRSGKFNGTGGEGENHKKLKEYVYNYPESVGIKNVKDREMEYNLLSGDRVDILFVLNDGAKIAVEIKPSTSPEADVLRGLYQCVKYKSIMDAEDKVHGNKANNSTILVIGGELSSENRKVREILGINVKEKVEI